MALFEGLTDKLQKTIKNIRGKGRVTEKDIKQMTREIKLALLEADVNYMVVKDFIGHIKEKALGSEILESLTPGQQVVNVIHKELISLLGSSTNKAEFSSKPPTIFMMTGLQGSGKTTTTGKLANIFRKEGKKPLLAACDVYRPAAVKQLQIVGKQLDIPVFCIEGNKNPVKIAKEALKYAEKNLYDLLIIDTAGRLHIDQEMMDELKNIKKAVNPHEILLVVDSMTGQDAVNVSKTFNEALEINGVILTKLDGDTRGGAALSVKSVTGKPIKYIGFGEKLNDIELFHPDRMASRILGMGDVLSLIEKAEQAFDEKKAAELEKKLMTQQFSLDDYLSQMEQLKNMGPIENILGMMPGISNKALKGMDINDKKLSRNKAAILSMTKKERLNPSIINASRKKRIAKGSGTSVQDVNILLRDFEQIKKMFKMMSGKNSKMLKKFKNLNLPF